MAGRIAYYGNIVTSGLVLNLDAAKRDSYPGSGTTWRDISGNGNNLSLSLISGSLYDTTNQGVFKFSGSSSFANFSSAINFENSTAFTLEGVVLIPTFSQFANRVHWIGGSGGNSMVLFYSNAFYMWNQGGGVNSLSIPATFNTNTIYHVIVTRDTSNNIILYVNGSNIGSGNRDGQFIWATIARLGSGLDYCSVINISKMNVYNRALSAQEVLQNYNATKTRYGL